MIKAPAWHFLSFSALVLWFALAAIAQAPAAGRLTGTVTDPQGAVVPRSLVVAKNALTGSEFRTAANEVGVWVIPSVPSGNYTISVTTQGFRTATSKEIRVDTGTTATVDATLQVALPTRSPSLPQSSKKKW
jgi:hypothetical protein